MLCHLFHVVTNSIGRNTKAHKGQQNHNMGLYTVLHMYWDFLVPYCNIVDSIRYTPLITSHTCGILCVPHAGYAGVPCKSVACATKPTITGIPWKGAHVPGSRLRVYSHADH